MQKRNVLQGERVFGTRTLCTQWGGLVIGHSRLQKWKPIVINHKSSPSCSKKYVGNTKNQFYVVVAVDNNILNCMLYITFIIFLCLGFHIQSLHIHTQV